MSFNVKLARQKLPSLSMTDKIELAHLALDEIEALQSQLAARNQAAEAMGVLERLVRETEDDGIAAVQMWKNSTGYRLSRTSKIINTEANSLIEAVLKAGGEDD